MEKLNFSFKGYEDHADLNVMVGNDLHTTVDIYLDELDLGLSASQLVQEIKTFDVDPVLPSGHEIDQDSLDVALGNLHVWIEGKL